MALTYELERRDSPVREFFEMRFPAAQFKPLSKAWRETVRAVPIVCVPPPGVNPGTIGTAFDYRARLCWGSIDWETTVAARGMATLFDLGHAELGKLAFEVEGELARIASNRTPAVPGTENEDRLCRCCYALALFEQFFRTPVAAISSPLLELGKGSGLEDVLSLAPHTAVDDIGAMARVLCEQHPTLIALSAKPNPRFDGSAEIGGADADLIVDGMLLELKTTRQDKFGRVDHLYQLLGYALLDYSDQYRLNALGVYLARRGLLVSWEIEELLATCCVTTDWVQLRLDFRSAVVSASALGIDR